MLTRRLQVLIDDERHRRLQDEAARRRVPVSVLVRDAIDAACPTTADARQAAGRRVLGAEPMDVPDPDALRSERGDLRVRCAFAAEGLRHADPSVPGMVGGRSA